jgi:hypothetical protein
MPLISDRSMPDFSLLIDADLAAALSDVEVPVKNLTFK